MAFIYKINDYIEQRDESFISTWNARPLLSKFMELISGTWKARSGVPAAAVSAPDRHYARWRVASLATLQLAEVLKVLIILSMTIPYLMGILFSRFYCGLDLWVVESGLDMDSAWTLLLNSLVILGVKAFMNVVCRRIDGVISGNSNGYLWYENVFSSKGLLFTCTS